MNFGDGSCVISPTCYYPCFPNDICCQPPPPSPPCQRECYAKKPDTLMRFNCLPPLESKTIYGCSFLPNKGDFRPKPAPPTEVVRNIICNDKEECLKRRCSTIHRMSYMPQMPITHCPISQQSCMQECCMSPPMQCCNGGCMMPMGNIQYCNCGCMNANFG